MLPAALSLLLVTAVQAQSQPQAQVQPQPNVGCIDKGLLLFADDVKRGLEKQGMSIYRDAMINMESDTPFPVMVKFDKGHVYQLLFVGNQEAAKAMMELFDGDDNKIGSQTVTKNSTPRYIIYGFTPMTTDTYLIMLSQRMKNKSMCGSFTILEQGGSAPAQPPAAPATVQPDKKNSQKPNSNRYIGPSGNGKH